MQEKNRINDVVTQSVEWIWSLQGQSGGFPFAYSDPDNYGAWATAQAVVALLSANHQALSRLDNSLEWLKSLHRDFLWSSMEQGTTLLDSSAWVVLALGLVGETKLDSQAIVEKSLMRIIESVNENGGWGSWVGDPSRTITSSIILHVLKTLDHTTLSELSLRRVIENGLKFLADSQHRDGGWGYKRGAEESSVLATSYALIALSQSNLYSEHISAGLEWLEAQGISTIESDKNMFTVEAISRKEGIQRWRHFIIPVMVYAFVANHSGFSAFKYLRFLLGKLRSQGYWVDPDEPSSAFHTYVATYFLSRTYDEIDINHFERYCTALELLQREENESLILAKKSKLKRFIIEDALKRDEVVVLKSGTPSNYYFDIKEDILEDPERAEIVGQLIWEMIKDDEVDLIGGPETGAIPIGSAVTRVGFLAGKHPRGFYVRTKPKEHGKQRWIVGRMRRGARVIVVEDVVTTGGSVLTAIDKILEYNCEILKVICIVNRGTEAVSRFHELGIELISLFSHTDFEDVM